MSRITYSTTLQRELITKTKALAHSRGLGGANDIIEYALQLYFELLGFQLLEKELPNGKYHTVTIYGEGMTLDYVEKRITIDTISDTQKLIEDGYHVFLEVK